MKHMLLLILSLCLAGCLAGFSSKPKTPTTPPGNLAAIQVTQSPHLGIAFPPQGRLAMVKALGAGAARIDAPWSRHEPTQGAFTFPGLDAKLDSLDALGIIPWLTLVADAPAWTGWTQTAADNEAPGPNGNLIDWARFVTTVVERYDNDGIADTPKKLQNPLRHIVMLNEWTGRNNPNGGWAGAWAGVQPFITATANAARAAYADVVITLGGPSLGALDVAMVALRAESWNITVDGPTTMTAAQIQSNKTFVAQAESVSLVYKNLTDVDFLSLHQYGPPYHYYARPAFLDSLTEGRFELMSDEAGGPSLLYVKGFTQAEHFAHALDLNLFNLSCGVSPTLWFHLIDTGNESAGNADMPLIGSNGVRRGGWYAYKVLALCLMKDMDHVEQVATGVYLITYTSGERTFVMVNGMGAGDFTLPPGVLAKQCLSINVGMYSVLLMTPAIVDHRDNCVIISERVLIP